jgi:acylglycerol lipase
MHSFLTSTAHTPNTPLFLVGHSMGGGQALTYILHPSSPYHTDKPTLSGVLVWSPLITLDPSSQPWRITMVAGRLAARILPKRQRYSPLDADLISRDKRVVEQYKADELCHDFGTLEGLRGMLDRGLWLDEVGGEVYERAGGLPLWVGHGDCDRVTSFGATRALAGRLKGKGNVTFVEYEGAFHTLHAELPETTGRFVEDVVAWVLARCPVDEGGDDVSGEGGNYVEMEQKDVASLGETEAERSKAKL